jgi:hypothetical protein
MCHLAASINEVGISPVFLRCSGVPYVQTLCEVEVPFLRRFVRQCVQPKSCWRILRKGLQHAARRELRLAEATRYRDMLMTARPKRQYIVCSEPALELRTPRTSDDRTVDSASQTNPKRRPAAAAPCAARTDIIRNTGSGIRLLQPDFAFSSTT